MTRDPHELLAAIYTDPFDDELRRVYADLLLELGDPRGELIQLQLARHERGATPEQLQRERELIDKHAAHWIGPLVAVVESFELERGLLSKCVVPAHRRPENIARVVGHPAWSTVVELEAPSAIYLDPVMRALRCLTTTHAEGLDELGGGDVRRPLHRLACELGRPEPPRYRPSSTLPPPSVFAATALPELHTLAIDAIFEPEQLRSLPPLGAHIRRLVLVRCNVEEDPSWQRPRREHRLGTWIEEANLALRVPVLELVEWRTTWTLIRSAHSYDHLVVAGESRRFPDEPLPLRRVDVATGTPEALAFAARFPEGGFGGPT